jgi:hypothetical protein
VPRYFLARLDVSQCCTGHNLFIEKFTVNLTLHVTPARTLAVGRVHPFALFYSVGLPFRKPPFHRQIPLVDPLSRLPGDQGKSPTRNRLPAHGPAPIIRET